MATHQYYSSSGSKVSVTAKISFCMREGPMSFCKAVEISDQHGCKYREDATNADHCMYYREDFDGACDCIFAHQGIEKPKVEEEANDEVEQAMTIVPT